MTIVYGINPVTEALRRNSEDIKTVIIAIGREGAPLHKLLTLATEKGVSVQYWKREDLDRLAGSIHHQGVVAQCRGIRYASVEEIVAHRPQGATGDLVVLLDGITDPQNLGALIRTGHCFGVNGFVIPENRSASLSASVLKASAGAMLYTPVAMVVNLARTIDYLKDQGFWIYGADAGGSSDLNVFDRTRRVALVMGSEGKGIRPLVSKKCDFLVSIPMKGQIDSLNVSVAAGIIMHAITNLWDKT
jgi:23S rRNA (guanosine2251-2'-O)-methyltransferase